MSYLRRNNSQKQLELNLWTCLKCDHHFRISSLEYVSFLLIKIHLKKWIRKCAPLIHLSLPIQKYADRITSTIKKLDLNDAVRTGTGKIDGREVAFACMDFQFIGGSMGSVVGEKLQEQLTKLIKVKFH